MHRVLETLQQRFPSAVLSVTEDEQRGELSAKIRAKDLVDVARFLHDDPGMAFDHITDICSADYPDDSERFEVIYQFLSLPHRTRIRLKARVTEDDPTIDTVTPIWQGANFLEREVFDLMGIRFEFVK